MKTNKTQRELAMSWWNNLSSLRKTVICDTNTNLVGAVRRHETLTGREIEMVYKKQPDIFLNQFVENYLEKDYGQYMHKELLKVVILEFIKENPIAIYQSLTNNERLDLIDMADISNGELK